MVAPKNCCLKIKTAHTHVSLSVVVVVVVEF